MNTRGFYKTTITFDVLSLEPIPNGMSLEAISTIGYPMSNLKRSRLQMSEQEMGKELIKIGYSHDFFKSQKS
jgi:hypothetical protein